MLMIHQTAAKNPAAMSTGHDAASIRKDVVSGKRRSKYLVDRTFFGLPLGNDMEADQRDGLPPTTFFSHNSDKV